jgi:aspartyl-tRNA synthetase
MFEMDEETQRIGFSHNPFSMPQGGLESLQSNDPLQVLAFQYDIVCNGAELGGGSIRIHSLDMQRRVFGLLGIGEAEAHEKFDFLMTALRYGAPPHGGIALGLDRVVAMMLGRESIRDVIAFPKTQRGTCPLTGAPAPVDDKQLAELDLRVIAPPASA